MRQLSVLFGLILCFTFNLNAQKTAPSPDEIATAYLEAIGGAEAWKEVKSMRFSGKANMQGQDFPFVMTRAEGNKFYQEVSIMGSKMEQGFNGETAWMLFPMQGINEKTAMSEEESKEFQEEEFLDVFIGYADRGFKLEAVDGKEIEGTPTYGVRVTNEGSYDKTYYFETENLVPIMISSVGKSGQTKGMTVEMYMSDYQEVDGLMMPMFMDMKINGNSFQKLTMTKGEMNVEIDDAIFELK
ncbi:hypothetical protein [Neolewinella persica]|uniref:hypothetical protein n=1 Tax=Neolewinella persica TaxID=70998 RepID=UPI000375A120|nr:hypothetical protein [Neolewinella persica]